MHIGTHIFGTEEEETLEQAGDFARRGRFACYNPQFYLTGMGSTKNCGRCPFIGESRLVSYCRLGVHDVELVGFYPVTDHLTFPLSDNPEIAVAEMVDVRVLLAALETGLIKGPDSEQKTPRQLEFQLASA